MTRAKRSRLPNCSVTELIDVAVEQTVRRFVKNLVCGTWKDVFDAYDNIPTDDDDDEDYTEYDENDPEQRAKIARHIEYIDKAMELWGVMVRKRSGLSFLTMTPIMAQGSVSTGANAPKKTPSPYIQFCKEMRPKIRSESPDLAFGDIAKELGKRWKALSAEEKRRFAHTEQEQEHGNQTVVEASAPAPVLVSAPAPAPTIRMRMSHDGDDSDDDDNDNEHHEARSPPPHRAPATTEARRSFPSSSLNLLDGFDGSSDEEETDEPLPFTSTQTERPEPKEPVIVKNFIGMPQKNMTSEERKAFKRYKSLDYNALLSELEYNNIFVVESTPPNAKKQQEIINALMNATFFPDGIAPLPPSDSS